LWIDHTSEAPTFREEGLAMRASVLVFARRRSGYAALLALIMFLSGCSGLGSEPPIVATLPPRATVSVSPTSPPSPTAPAEATEPPTAPDVEATEEAGVADTMTPAATPEGVGGQPPVATEEAAPVPAEVIGTVSGNITNATAGGSVPPDLTVELFVIDQDGNEQVFPGEADAEGRFTFSEVPIRSDRAYTVAALYNNRRFGSQTLRGDVSAPQMTLPITIYELTQDPATVEIASVLIRFNVGADAIEVGQVMRLTNISDRVFTGVEEVRPGQYRSLVTQLPAGAQLLDVASDPQRYLVLPDGTITDTQPLLPGETRTVHVIYVLPYQSSGTTIEVPLTYALDGSLQMLVGPLSVEAFVNAGGRAVPSRGLQASTQGNVTTYGDTLTLDAGGAVRVELRGSAVAAPSTGVTTGTSFFSRDLIVGLLIGAGFGLIIVGGFFLLRDRAATRRETGPGQTDTLIADLARLDEQFHQGAIDRVTYEKQRDRLKARLARLMKR
jgi:hypothetical protein